MTNEQVEAALVAAIRSCLEASGKVVAEINADTVPLKDVADFDSLCAIEVLVDIESQCGLKAEIDVFLEAQGKRARNRTVREIAAAINQ